MVDRPALWPLAKLYEAGWAAYAGLYRAGLKRAAEPFKPVVCVGNLVVGGSGKTPATLAVARALVAAGRSVAVSMSGYGAPRSRNASLAPEGELDAREWGDEPAMVRWLAPELDLIVGRDRVRAAEIARDRFAGRVLLLDDGFQHLPLRKHVSILLDPPDGGRLCLPAGPYREPRRNLARADLVLGDPTSGFELRRGELRFVVPARGDAPERPIEPPVEADALSAVARPARFLADLRRAGVEVRAARAPRDHDPLLAGTLFADLSPDLPLVVTAKDWVKLRNRPDLGDRSIVVAIETATIEPEAAFARWLDGKLDP